MSNVQVAVRARPLAQREVDLKSPQVIEMRSKSTLLYKSTAGVVIGEMRDASKEFVYDHSYWSVDSSDSHYASQEKVFNDLGKVVLESAFEGYNACVFAYGQTGSGKTYTMMGTENDPGLIPRICQQLFSRIATGSLKKVSYKTEACYMEIYNEKVRDLLHHESGKSPSSLRVREHPRDGPYVENLSRHQVSDYHAIRKLMDLGNAHRATASTKMNDVSSRSHAIFTITFTQATYSADLPCETVSKINLVDLAGSERASTTGAEGIRLKEGGNINKSLVSLGNVISALADMSTQSHFHKKPYIPYRDSTLTWLIKDSLGGNSKTIMIATISPADCCYGETLSTLRYASRAKNIVNKPVVNEDPNVKLIRELRAEIQRLKGIISGSQGQIDDANEFRSRKQSIMLAANIHRKEEQIAELTKTWAERWEGIQKIIEDRNVDLQREGIKMTVASEQPYLLALDEDAFGTGVVLYHLQEGCTTIGSLCAGAVPKPDIVLNVSDVEPEHCELMYSDGKVVLKRVDGKCHVSGVEVARLSLTKLSHGDIVQLGSQTVFRFNYPQEAAQMRMENQSSAKLRPLDLSPMSPSSLYEARNALEEHRSALQRDYELRLREMREEIEREREEEVVKLREEVERLKQSQTVTDSDVDIQQPFELDNEAYNVMRSIAFDPFLQRSVPSPGLETIREREIVGGEAETDTGSPVHVGTHSAQTAVTGTQPDTNHSSNDVTPPNASNVIQKPEDPIDTSTPKSGSKLDINYIGRNLTEFDLDTPDGQANSNEQNGMLEQERQSTRATRTDTQGVTRSSHQTESLTPLNDSSRLLASLEGRLQNEKEKHQMTEIQLKDAEREREEALRKSKDLEVMWLQEKEITDVEKQQLQARLERAEAELLIKSDFDELGPQTRRRSYALGEREQQNKPKFQLRRTRSTRGSTTLFKIEIPSFVLRGSGIGSYHLYEIKIRLGSEKWFVYKRYRQFKYFHSEMTARYPELSALSLPPSKWFGFRDAAFVEKRRQALERYLQSFVAISTSLSTCPLSETAGKKLTREHLERFNSFFAEGEIGIQTSSLKLP